MSWTKAAFTECTLRSLKYYSKLHGRLWIQAHSQNVSFRYNPELYTKNLSMNLIAK